jgi:hypothetical protein
MLCCWRREHNKKNKQASCGKLSEKKEARGCKIGALPHDKQGLRSVHVCVMQLAPVGGINLRHSNEIQCLAFHPHRPLVYVSYSHYVQGPPLLLVHYPEL